MNNGVKTALSFSKDQLAWEDISGREVLLYCFPDGKADLAEGGGTCTRPHSLGRRGPWGPLMAPDLEA